mgnify:CR=1 FL=1
MFRADDYVKVSDLAEAYELCQKRSSLVVGGMVWMKMTHITKRTIVDLSGLGLDEIEEIHGLYSPVKLGFAAALACSAFTLAVCAVYIS